jgi:superfamily II DNA or RNA helicase
MSDDSDPNGAPRPVDRLRERLRPYQREALDALEAGGPKSIDLTVMDAGRRRVRENQAAGRTLRTPRSGETPAAGIVTLTYADFRKPPEDAGLEIRIFDGIPKPR